MSEEENRTGMAVYGYFTRANFLLLLIVPRALAVFHERMHTAFSVF